MSSVTSKKKTHTSLLTRPDTNESFRSEARTAKGGRPSYSRASNRADLGDTTTGYGAITDWAVTDSVWSAARYGSYHRLKHMIEGHADINKRNVQGWTCLHVACEHNKPGIVELLLQQKADYTIRTDKKQERNWQCSSLRTKSPECVHQMLRYIDISMPQIEKMYREATRWRQYDMQEVLRKYMRSAAGERVKAKYGNADVEEVIPPPLIIRPFLDYWGNEVIRTEEEKESKPVQIGAYANLRDARHRQNRKMISKKIVFDWSPADFAYWVSQQPTLENDSKEFERAIKKGKISGKVISIQNKANFKTLLNNLGFNVPARKFLLNSQYQMCTKDGSHEASNNLAKENKVLLPISRRSPPFYNVVTIVEISAKTTLKSLHKELNKTIKKDLKMRPFVFMRPDGNRIPAAEDHNYNAKEFLHILY